GFWSGGLPTGALVDLASTGKMKIVPIGEYADDLAKEYGGFYMKKDVPANTYDGQTEAVTVISSPNVLVARKDMPKDLAEPLTADSLDHLPVQIKGQSDAKELDGATAGEVPFMETRVGAQAYYDQAGG